MVIFLMTLFFIWLFLLMIIGIIDGAKKTESLEEILKITEENANE